MTEEEINEQYSEAVLDFCRDINNIRGEIPVLNFMVSIDNNDEENCNFNLQTSILFKVNKRMTDLVHKTLKDAFDSISDEFMETMINENKRLLRENLLKNKQSKNIIQ